jgi:hypothetical protein
MDKIAESAVFQAGILILMNLMLLRSVHAPGPSQFIATGIMITLIAWLSYGSIKHTRFCDRCGGWATTSRFFTSFPGRCEECGADITTKPEPPDNSLE